MLFAQLVDDPSSRPDEFPTEEAQEAERERLFEIIRNLVKWENSNNEHVLNAARAEILKSTGGNPPPVLDPFCGGGSIPLEAQRLGLEAHASDLNPVAVLITKALIEIPPKFAGRPPVHPAKDPKLLQHEWRGAQGLAEDMLYYGQWMRDEAEKRIGHLYPKVKLPKEYSGGEATVIAWLWARTVKCPNPACGAMMPLVRSFSLSTKKGKEAWVNPVIDRKAKTVRFEVNTGAGTLPNGTVNRRGARCVVCSEPVSFDHVRAEGKAGRMSTQLMAIVAEGVRERIYLPPSVEHEATADEAHPVDMPDTDLPEQALGFRVQGYGMTKHRDLFTQRQLVALTTFSDLVSKARERVLADARNAGIAEDDKGINEGGRGTAVYADAVTTYLGFSIGKIADRNSTIATWAPNREHARNTFTRQAISMTWDFAESNIFSNSSGNYFGGVETIVSVLENIAQGSNGFVQQRSASSIEKPNIVYSTDPPYYDNVPYADLSDFFHIWLRLCLQPIYPEHFGTVLVPKTEELVAEPFRHGGKDNARLFFEKGMAKVFRQMRECCATEYPTTVFYAFKQAEDDEADEDDELSSDAQASTGWETMLEGMLQVGLQVNGTWPMRTELGRRMRNFQSNALASSIVLVCRPRSESALPATRRDFVAALKRELPDALRKLQHGNIAPVDLAQASIGPGMAIFSRYAKVLEADGRQMSVRTALQIINQELDAYLAAQEGEMDRDTRFCLAWFEQYGMNDGPFGEADVLARAKNTAVQGLVEAGVIHSKAGKVRLLKRSEYQEHWNPSLDPRVTVWECTQHLIRLLNADTGGEETAARLVNQIGSRSEDARALAYRLYSICERKKWADEALAYNTLVVEWPAIQDKAAQIRVMPTEQTNLFS